jgi:dihydrofolate reductase
VLADTPEGGVYTFVTDGIESALEQAKAAAGGKDVSVMGGVDIGRQYIAAGLVDEIQIHLVPVLFGSGTRMFGHLGSLRPSR